MIVIKTLQITRKKTSVIKVEMMMEENLTLIEKYLREYYKRRPLKLAELDRIGWNSFVRNEVAYWNNTEVRDVIVDAITKDVSLKSFSLNRKTLFPIKD